MFTTSAAVLVIEIVAVRLLAPYLGVSLEVFTAVIGVILGGISVGAWVGGRAADRLDPRRLPGPLLTVGGLTTLAAPLLVDLVGPLASTSPISTVMAASLVFIAPAAILSAVPPVVVKIQLETLERTGTVVGSYSAIGTAGALLGTFVTGFVLIRAFPTRPIVAVTGLVLAVGGLVMSAGRRSWAVMATLTSCLLATALVVADGPCEYETTYHCAIVAEDMARPTGRTLILDRLSNSYVDISDPTYLHFRYVELVADVFDESFPAGPLDVVSIGGGGFTLPGYLAATRPGGTNTVLEIDAALIDIARSQLALDDEIEVVVADARISIRDFRPSSADLVIGDAFAGASVPWHLTTVEFNEQVAELLRPGGIYVMNVIDYPQRLGFVRAEAKTLLDVFGHVALFAPNSYLDGEAGGNYILVAGDEPVDIGRIQRRVASRGGNEVGIQGTALLNFIGDARALTDDFAPVDQLLVG